MKSHKGPRNRFRPQDGLNIGQAAAHLQLSRSQFRGIMDQIPHDHFSPKHFRFSVADLDAFRAAHRHQPVESSHA